MFNTVMGILTILLMVGSVSLLIVFDSIRDEVRWQTSRLGRKIEKLCKIGTVISTIIMYASAIFFLQFISFVLLTITIS